MRNLPRKSLFKLGDHVRVKAFRGIQPHPHAGKTGSVYELLGLYVQAGEPRAMIKLDPGIEPEGFIVVSFPCLEIIT
jgi:hypothetical protein